MTLFHRRTLFAFFLGATLAAAVVVGRSAFATTETINACFKPSNGTLYLLGESSGRHECQPGDIPISWNTSGVNGQDGVSVTSQALAPGDDSACPNGGTKFTSANNVVSYACNGTNGQDGQSFSGTFTSPNGQFRLVVADTGIRLENLPPLPPARIQLSSNNVQIQTQGLFSASGAVTTIGGSQLTVSGGSTLNLNGALVSLNGSGCGVLRGPDVNPIIGPTGGPTLLNPNGSPTVRTGC